MRRRVLPRTHFGNSILSTRAKQVSLAVLKKPETQELIQQMIYTMRRTKGVGIAAPQVGIPLRIAVMEIRKLKHRPALEHKGPLVIVNPKITRYSKETMPMWEGCLSLPNVQAMAVRSTSVTVEFMDEAGKKHTEEAEGLWAEIFQHEIDHLNGIRYMERVEDNSTIVTLNELKKKIAAERKKAK